MKASSLGNSVNDIKHVSEIKQIVTTSSYMLPANKKRKPCRTSSLKLLKKIYFYDSAFFSELGIVEKCIPVELDIKSYYFSEL